MKTWIALLRGVNVGGHNKLPMAAFRQLLSDMGFVDVATYIQSGNAVFAADGNGDQIGTEIGRAIKAQFGFLPSVLMLSRDELQAAIAANPFAQAQEEPSTLHLIFMRGEVDLPTSELQAYATKGEEFQQIGSVLYLFTPNGFGVSDLAARIDRLIKAPMTARNFRSALKIADLAAKIDA